MNSINRRLTTVAIAGAIVAVTLGVSHGITCADMRHPVLIFIVSHRRLCGWIRSRARRSARLPGTLSVPGEGSPGAATFREAPAAFDNRTNGFDPQGPAFDTIDEETVVPLRSFNDNRFIFEEVEGVADGLGPTFNAQACRECHQNIVTGGASQIAEHRTGRLELLQFVESVGGSLIQSRSTHPDIFERVPFEDSVSTLRISTNTLGAGFIEAVANSTLLAIRDRQPAAIRGTALEVAVLEANNAPRIGRFGWKSQHASLESFAADAYLNEMGITTPILPDENTSLGRDRRVPLRHSIRFRIRKMTAST